MGSYFSSNYIENDFKGVIITLQRSSYNNFKINYLKIDSENPMDLYDDIIKDPIIFCNKYGYSRDCFHILGIKVYGIQDTKLSLLLRIANYMNLDITNIKNNEDLEKLIDIHIKYSPPHINMSHSGYYKSKEDFDNRIKNNKDNL